MLVSSFVCLFVGLFVWAKRVDVLSVFLSRETKGHQFGKQTQPKSQPQKGSPIWGLSQNAGGSFVVIFEQHPKQPTSEHTPVLRDTAYSTSHCSGYASWTWTLKQGMSAMTKGKHVFQSFPKLVLEAGINGQELARPAKRGAHPTWEVESISPQGFAQMA